MQELDVNAYLTKENLFVLFKTQLAKDFESSGINADFVKHLPSQFDLLKRALGKELSGLLKSRSFLLGGLLYKIDISENQLAKYESGSPAQSFEEVLSEIIIKRVLQKIILKKHFLDMNALHV